jgi:hypothetical protein
LLALLQEEQRLEEERLHQEEEQLKIMEEACGAEEEWLLQAIQVNTSFHFPVSRHL